MTPIACICLCSFYVLAPVLTMSLQGTLFSSVCSLTPSFSVLRPAWSILEIPDKTRWGITATRALDNERVIAYFRMPGESWLSSLFFSPPPLSFVLWKFLSVWTGG